jgi:hypothetical protein
VTIDELAQTIDDNIKAAGHASVETTELINLFSSSHFDPNVFFFTLDVFAQKHGWEYGPKAKEIEYIAERLIFRPLER